jgi:hypothetical protein
VLFATLESLADRLHPAFAPTRRSMSVHLAAHVSGDDDAVRVSVPQCKLRIA